MSDDDAQEDAPFRDAESWLAELGVERDPIRVDASAPADPPAAQPSETAEAASAEALPTPGDTDAGASEADGGASAGSPPPADDVESDGYDELADDGEVKEAVAYAQRATASSPMSEGRLRRRMEDRGIDGPTIERALERCRRIGIVDDAAFSRALVDEGRRKGYAPARIRRDLRRREFAAEAIETAMSTIGDRDLEAAAYAVAQGRAAKLGGVDAETAFRRLVGFLARRGYPESLARKVARQAVFNDREVQRTTER